MCACCFMLCVLILFMCLHIIFKTSNAATDNTHDCQLSRAGHLHLEPVAELGLRNPPRKSRAPLHQPIVAPADAGGPLARRRLLALAGPGLVHPAAAAGAGLYYGVLPDAQNAIVIVV